MHKGGTDMMYGWTGGWMWIGTIAGFLALAVAAVVVINLSRK